MPGVQLQAPLRKGPSCNESSSQVKQTQVLPSAPLELQKQEKVYSSEPQVVSEGFSGPQTKQFLETMLTSSCSSLEKYKLTDLGNGLMVAEGKDEGEGIGRQFGMEMYTLLYSKRITNKDLLYSTWNSAQCYVAA